jgi:DNA-binding response OmpR family regulator
MLVLIVEDEPFSALSAAWELERAGHDVLGPSASLEDALRLARTHRPDLALVDIDLQHTGEGLELARALREMDIVSLFVSAENGLASRNSDLAVGFIGKPYDPDDLARSVDVVDALMHGKEPPAAMPMSLQIFH